MRIYNAFIDDNINSQSGAQCTTGGDCGVQGLVNDVTYVMDKIRAEHPELTEKQLVGLDTLEQRLLNNATSQKPGTVDMGADTLISNMVGRYLGIL